MKIAAFERFLRKVKKTKTCWLWTGGLTGGYGAFRFTPKKMGYAHRFSYEHFRGKIPKGLQIDHLCRNRRCVNPKHLEVVTQHENLLRGEGIPGVNSRKTHCKRGHEFTPENTDLLTSGRRCKKCLTFLARRYYRQVTKQKRD